MIFDLNAATGKEFAGADVCIIGTGAVGLVLALELTRLGKRVLMLEAGGREIEKEAQDAYRSEVTGLRHNGIHIGRFCALGGTTRRWGGQVLELDAIDFEARPWIDGSGWPIRKQELASFYRRSIELLGLGKSLLRDADVWSALRQAPPKLDDRLISYFTRWCPEPDFALLHGPAAENSDSLGIYLHARACALQTASDGRTILGVRCKTPSGAEATFTAAHYVLCMGTIETSRFLLQPERVAPGEWRESRWNASGMLGKHFQDHADANAASIHARDPNLLRAYFDNVYLRGLKYHPKLKLSAAMQEQMRTLNIASTLTYASDIDETLINTKAIAKQILRGRLREVQPAEIMKALAHLPVLARQFVRYKLHHRAYNPPSAQVGLRVHCEQEPLSASSISLSSERDSYGLLRARLDWRVSEREQQTIRSYVKVVKDSFHAAGIGEVLPDRALAAPDGDLSSIVDDSNHHMGGARMSVSASDGVVDSNLRLHAAANGYVCGGAVFPSSGSSNPTHTMLALAVRLAKHLAESTLPEVHS